MFLNGEDYIIDLGIYRNEIDLEGHNDFYYKSTIVDQGDLSTYYGFETFNASGYKIVPPKVYPKTVTTIDNNVFSENQLKNGYGFIKWEELPATSFAKMPVNFVPEKFELPEFVLKPGVNPNFFLEKDGKLTHAVINGFLLDLNRPLDEQKFGNALLIK